MIGKLLNEINEKMEVLNKVILDNDYFKDLEKRCDFINSRCSRLEKENIKLDGILNIAIEWVEYQYEYASNSNNAYMVAKYKELLNILKEGNINE